MISNSIYLTVPDVTGVIDRVVTDEQGRIWRTRRRLSKILGNYKKRAKKCNVLTTLTFTQLCDVMNKSYGICCYCKIQVGIDALGLDHVIPMSKGGSNTIDNVVACCFDCNVRKSNKII